MNMHIREMVEEIVGEIIGMKVLDEQGGTSEVRRVLTEDGSYLLKSSFNKRYREWLAAEAKVLEKLGGKNLIPVPDYYGMIEDDESSHMIVSFIEGMTLTAALKKSNDPSEQAALIKSFGHFLQQLHGTEPIEELIEHEDWLEGQLEKAKRYVESGQTEGSSQLLETLKSTKPRSVKQTIIHGDCTTDNVLVVDGKVRYFIDLSGMTVGDPRYDESLAVGSLDGNHTYIKAFYEGYGRHKVTEEEFQYFNDGLYEFF